MKLSRVDLTISHDGGNVDYVEVLRAGDLNLRIKIHSDTSYRNQSWCRIERWDGAQWREVHAIAGTAMETSAYYSGHANPPGHLPWDAEHRFRLDRTELLRVAAAVLGFDLEVA